MKKNFLLAAVAFGLISGNVASAPLLADSFDHDHDSGWCFPENKLKIGVNDVNVMAGGGINEATFNAAIDRALAIYTPIVRARGANLIARRLWQDATVNAKAYQQGANWYIEMYGGLARHSTVDLEGFYTVICHEIGHHLGGKPTYSGAGNTWAATEGQSDYFATLKCMRKVFAGMPNEIRDEEPGLRTACERSFTNADDITACVRIAMGGYSSGRLSHTLAGGGGSGPNIATPDPRVVNSTYESHPAAQCRLDTYFNGAICPVSADADVSFSDAEAGGVCSVTQKHQFGKRPLCWYKAPAGGGDNPPTGDTAAEPKLNGQILLATSDPYQQVVITYDVSNFTNVAGVYIEVSKANTPFSNPNGTTQDPNAFGGVGVRGAQGQYAFIPAQTLPSWGTYYVRVIPLDASGRVALGKFSNPSKLMLSQARGGGFPRRPLGAVPRFGAR